MVKFLLSNENENFNPLQDNFIFKSSNSGVGIKLVL